jgi:hypothetical protein
MNTQTARTAAVLGIGALLLSGLAAAAPANARDLPAVAAAERSAAVKDDLSPTRRGQSAQHSVPGARSWSNEARREFHAQRPQEQLAGSARVSAEPREWTGAQLRELKGSPPRP